MILYVYTNTVTYTGLLLLFFMCVATAVDAGNYNLLRKGTPPTDDAMHFRDHI